MTAACANCDRLTRALREAREALDEFRLAARDEVAAQVEVGRVARVAAFFGIKKAEARLLMLLCACPGLIRPRGALLDALGSLSDGGGVIKTYTCRIRAGFRRRGRPDPIRTHWGLGLSVSAKTAAAVAAIAEGTDA